MSICSCSLRGPGQRGETEESETASDQGNPSWWGIQLQRQNHFAWPSLGCPRADRKDPYFLKEPKGNQSMDLHQPLGVTEWIITLGVGPVYSERVRMSASWSIWYTYFELIGWEARDATRGTLSLCPLRLAPFSELFQSNADGALLCNCVLQWPGPLLPPNSHVL